MDEINVIVISSVRPEKSTAAAVTLHRHLVNRRGIQVHNLPAEHHEIVHGPFHSKIIPRLMRTPARRSAGDAPVRQRLVRRILELHRSADLSVSISEGELNALGPNRDARVILQIPDAEPIRPSKCTDLAGEFRVGYSGNMFDYSDMLAD